MLVTGLLDTDTHLRQHLFQKGFGKSTGLGLYLIRKICEVYGWAVQEKGQPGEGVYFEFTIPTNARVHNPLI